MGRVHINGPVGCGDIGELLLALKDSIWSSGESYNSGSAVEFRLPDKGCSAVILIKTAYHNCGLFLYRAGRIDTIWASDNASHSVTDSTGGGANIRIACPQDGTSSPEYQTYGYTII